MRQRNLVHVKGDSEEARTASIDALIGELKQNLADLAVRSAEANLFELRVKTLTERVAALEAGLAALLDHFQVRVEPVTRTAEIKPALEASTAGAE